jgi:hypothetical protein
MAKIRCEITHQLEVAEVDEVDDGDGAFWCVDLGFGEGDKLVRQFSIPIFGARKHTLSTFMVGRW